MPPTTISRLWDLPLHVPQHPNEHGPKDPVPLAVDQELGEGIMPLSEAVLDTRSN